MADIYLAKHTANPDHHVALKVLAKHRAVDPESVAMFLDEGRLMSMLDHPNLPHVVEVATTTDGRHYIALEYVHGVDLRELLSATVFASRTVPYETAIAIVMAAAEALDHAHRRVDHRGRPLGIVHRDVSLSNIMVGHDGVPRVVDFGIAKATVASIHTCPGVVRGKASYMSPEQCLGDRVDHRTDVFALGIVLYELTTGARCFAGKSDFDRMLAIVRGEYIPPSHIVGDFPRELEHVIRCALSLDASRRYPSAAELAHALRQVLVARGWLGGRAAIIKTMSELFGSVAEPWVATSNDPTRTDAPRIEIIADPDQTIRTTVMANPMPAIPPPPQRSRRLARGTAADGEPATSDQPQLARGSTPEMRPAEPSYVTEPPECDDGARTGRYVIRELSARHRVTRELY